MSENKKLVAIIMGSDSDWPVMKFAAQMLADFEVPYEAQVISAHRTPDLMFKFAEHAAKEGYQIIIAGAGGAAHLPGMVAAITSLPVIGVPIKSSNSIDGWDSVLSILQMPAGVPVATVALNGAKNAGLLAAQIIGSSDAAIGNAMDDYKQNMEAEVLAKVEKMKGDFNNEFDKK